MNKAREQMDAAMREALIGAEMFVNRATANPQELTLGDLMGCKRLIASAGAVLKIMEARLVKGIS